MQSKAKTVEAYLAELAPERRDAIERVRRVILDHLPSGYEEALNWGMLTYQVPLEVEPDTHNKQPLLYAALASQKHHMAVYLTSICMDPDAQASFEAAYKATGKRYDVGKSCVRFKKLDDLPLDLIGKAIASMPVEDFVRGVEAARSRSKAG